MRFRRFLVLTALVLLGCRYGVAQSAPAQPFSFEALYSLKNHWSLTGTVSLKKIPALFGVSWLNPDIRGFGGINLSQGSAPTGGLAAAFTFNVSRPAGIVGWVGPFGQTTQQHHLDFGFLIGIRGEF